MYRFLIVGLTLVTCAVNAETIAVPTPVDIVEESMNKGLTEAQKIERLIQFVRTMKDATFIRNGKEHSCREAANHLQGKWEKHRNKINSAQDFINNLASSSGLSGEPYKIKFKDGSILTTNEVLSRELKRLEHQ